MRRVYPIQKFHKNWGIGIQSINFMNFSYYQYITSFLCISIISMNCTSRFEFVNQHISHVSNCQWKMKKNQKPKKTQQTINILMFPVVWWFYWEIQFFCLLKNNLIVVWVSCKKSEGNKIVKKIVQTYNVKNKCSHSNPL